MGECTGHFKRAASRHSRRLTVTILWVSASVTGVQTQEITYEKNLVGCKQAADAFVGTLRGLDDRLGPLLLQLGDRREFPSGHTHPKKDRTEDLRWWPGVSNRFLAEGKAVFAYANNHYQNHSPSTVEEFLELRRGDR